MTDGPPPPGTHTRPTRSAASRSRGRHSAADSLSFDVIAAASVAAHFAGEVEPIETDRVVARDPARLISRHPGKVAGDDLARMRPRRHRVRVVGGPHHVLDAHLMAILHAER